MARRRLTITCSQRGIEARRQAGPRHVRAVAWPRTQHAAIALPRRGRRAGSPNVIDPVCLGVSAGLPDVVDRVVAWMAEPGPAEEPKASGMADFLHAPA